MHWKLVLLLSLFGVAMGFLSVTGLTGAAEPFLWPIIGIVCALIIAMKADRPFVNGFATGLICGAVAPLIQTLLFTTYVANNPWMTEEIKQLPAGVSPRLVFAIQVPLIGLVSGLVLGLLSWLGRKVLSRRRQEITS